MSIDTGSSDIFIKGQQSKGQPKQKYHCGKYCLQNNPKYIIGYLDGRLLTYQRKLKVSFGSHVFNQSILIAFNSAANFDDTQGLIGLSYPNLATNPNPNFIQTLIQNKICNQYSFGVNLNFINHTNSVITFGGYNQQYFHGQIEQHELTSDNFYEINFQTLTIGNIQPMQISKAIIDTGNTCITIPFYYEVQILSQFVAFKNGFVVNLCFFSLEQNVPMFSLLKCRISDFSLLPTLQLKMNNKVYSIQKQFYLQGCTSSKSNKNNNNNSQQINTIWYCDTFIQSMTLGNKIFLGDGFLNKYYAYFNLERKIVGFAKNIQNVSIQQIQKKSIKYNQFDWWIINWYFIEQKQFRKYSQEHKKGIWDIVYSNPEKQKINNAVKIKVKTQKKQSENGKKQIKANLSVNVQGNETQKNMEIEKVKMTRIMNKAYAQTLYNTKENFNFTKVQNKQNKTDNMNKTNAKTKGKMAKIMNKAYAQTLYNTKENFNFTKVQNKQNKTDNMNTTNAKTKEKMAKIMNKAYAQTLYNTKENFNFTKVQNKQNKTDNMNKTNAKTKGKMAKIMNKAYAQTLYNTKENFNFTKVQNKQNKTDNMNTTNAKTKEKMAKIMNKAYAQTLYNTKENFNFTKVQNKQNKTDNMNKTNAKTKGKMAKIMNKAYAQTLYNTKENFNFTKVQNKQNKTDNMNTTNAKTKEKMAKIMNKAYAQTLYSTKENFNLPIKNSEVKNNKTLQRNKKILIQSQTNRTTQLKLNQTDLQKKQQQKKKEQKIRKQQIKNQKDQNKTKKNGIWSTINNDLNKTIINKKKIINKQQKESISLRVQNINKINVKNKQINNQIQNSSQQQKQQNNKNIIQKVESFFHGVLPAIF